MARRYKPIADSVLIEKMDMPDHTEGGILLPHVAQGDILKGKVIAVGPGMPDIPMFVKPDDVILYYSNKPITVDSYVLINQNCIYVVVEEDDEVSESDGGVLVANDTCVDCNIDDGSGDVIATN